MTNQTPLVSIIILAHKTPSLLLQRCINSILSQKGDFQKELLLIDTNPADSKYAKGIREDIAVYPQIRYHAHPDARNMAYAKNSGLKRSHGDYVCYLYGKDFWSDNWLHTMLGALKDAPECAAVCCPCQRLPDNILNPKNLVSKDTFADSSDKAASFPTKPFHYLAQILFRRRCLEEIDGFDPLLIDHTDWELCFRLSRSHSIKLLPSPADAYSYIDTSDLSAVPPKTTAIGYRQLYRKHRDYYRKHRQEKKLLYRRAAFYYFRARHYSRAIQFAWLGKTLRLSARNSPDIISSRRTPRKGKKG